MILGIGSDIVMISRIKALMDRWGSRFLNRLFTENEQLYAAQSATLEGQARTLAKRFAAKEAFVKALGTGFREGFLFKDIEVGNTTLGKPYIITHKSANDMIESCLCPPSVCKIHLSLSDERNMAMAFVVLEKNVD